MPYNPNAIPSIVSEEERRRLLQRGTYVPGGMQVNPETGQPEWGAGGFRNPGRVAGTVPESAGNVGPNYEERLMAMDVNRRDDFYGGFEQEQGAVGGGRTPVATGSGQPQLGQQNGIESPAVQEARQRWMQQQYAKNLISQGAIGVNFGTITPFHTNTQIEEMANQSARQGNQPGALSANQPGVPQMGGIAAESTDIQKNIALANRNKDVFLQERDRLWDLQNKQFEEDVRRQKLGMGELSVQERQLQLAKDIDAFEQTQRMRPITERQKVAELVKTEGEAADSVAEINRRQYYERLLLEPQQTPQQAANAVVTAANLKDINATWPDLKAVAENYNVPKDTIAKVYNGRAATTYDNPLEFVRDIGIKTDELGPITKINPLDASTTELIQTANQNNRPPDQALKEILKELNISKGDKNYVQTALDVAYGIQQVYNEAGNTAKQNAQETIAESNVQQGNKAVAQMTPLAQQVVMPDVVNSILASKQGAMDELLTASEMSKQGGTQEAGYSFGLRNKAFGRVGVNPRLAEIMSPEQIKQTVFDYLIQENRNDKQFVNFMVDQKNRPASQRDAKLEMFADSIVAPFNKGKKEALAEAEKEQVKRDKIAQDYADKEQEVYFDPKNDEPHVLPKGSLAQLATLSTPERVGYLQRAELISQKQLNDPNFKQFLKKPEAEKNEIYESINTAKQVITLGQQGLITADAIPILKGYKPTSVKELHTVINELSKTNGLPELEPLPEKSLEVSKLREFWNSLTNNQKIEQPTTTTTPVSEPVAEQPVTENKPVLTPEETAKTLPQRIRMPDGRIMVRQTMATPTPDAPIISTPAPVKSSEPPVVTPSPVEPVVKTKSAAEIAFEKRDREQREKFYGVTAAREKLEKEQIDRINKFNKLTADAPINDSPIPPVSDQTSDVLQDLKKNDLVSLFANINNMEQSLIDKGYTAEQARQLINARYYLLKQKAKK
jgi:hypothetical protein